MHFANYKRGFFENMFKIQAMRATKIGIKDAVAN